MGIQGAILDSQKPKNPAKLLGYGSYWISWDVKLVGRGLPNMIHNLLYLKR